VQSDDDFFYTRMERDHAHTPKYVPRRDVPPSLHTPGCTRMFGIQHFAGRVVYSVLDFVEKNNVRCVSRLRGVVSLYLCVSVSVFPSDSRRTAVVVTAGRLDGEPPGPADVIHGPVHHATAVRGAD
jgi:hypothetical protein